MALLAVGTTTGSDGTVGPTFLLALIGQIVLTVKLIRNAGGMKNKSGILLNVLFAISRYNDLVTRPVPNFFRREGANNARS